MRKLKKDTIKFEEIKSVYDDFDIFSLIFKWCENNNYKADWKNEIIEKVKEKFDLTPNGIIEYLKLKEPIYTKQQIMDTLETKTYLGKRLICSNERRNTEFGKR